MKTFYFKKDSVGASIMRVEVRLYKTVKTMNAARRRIAHGPCNTRAGAFYGWRVGGPPHRSKGWHLLVFNEQYISEGLIAHEVAHMCMHQTRRRGVKALPAGAIEETPATNVERWTNALMRQREIRRAVHRNFAGYNPPVK